MGALPVMPSNWLVPFFWAKVDASQATVPANTQRGLIMAERLAGGSVAANTLFQIDSEEDAAAGAGQGSLLHRMAHAYLRNNPYGELWGIGVADTAGTAASGDVTFGGTATASGTISLYIGGQLVRASVTTGDAGATTVATAVKTAIDANSDLPVTSGVVAAGAIPLTARNKGPHGNSIDLRFNYLGAKGGEVTPAGITAVVSTPMAGGLTAPTLTTTIAALGDEAFDWIMVPYNDTVSLNALQVEMDDSTGRWAPDRQLWSHFFWGLTGTSGTLASAGALRNDPHATCFGFHDSPTPYWEWLAAHVGQVSKSEQYLASRPFWSIEVNGCLAPPVGSAGRFTAAQKQTLLENGISISTVSGGGGVMIESVITNYLKTPTGIADLSMKQYNTIATLRQHMRRLRTAVEVKCARCVLVDDGTRVRSDLPVITPNSARGILIAEYNDMIRDALAENLEAFKANLEVTRSTVNPNRLDVKYRPDLANQLEIFDLLNQFRLQYPAVEG